MTLEEMASWIDYFAYNAKKEKDAMDKAKAKSKPPPSGNQYMGRR